jgi:Protein of unknown function (DUF3237)
MDARNRNRAAGANMSSMTISPQLPDPRLRKVYRLEVTLGEPLDFGEVAFRTSTQIETAAPQLDWLNEGMFISVGARQPAGAIYETYLVE